MTDDKRSDNLVGKQLGDYKLKSLLAEGGMARIYRAVDVELEREVAVKVLTSAMADSDTSLAERFQREAKAVAKLEHENIIPIYRAGQQDGYYYLAMKLVQGKDLADELNELKQQYKLMNPRRMLHIMEQVASALDFAHKADIVHRDVKPSNILIDDTGRALLSDFGLVLRLGFDKTLGTAFGTPRYISPEQALASEKALPASDIYSLGVIVYEILTGHMLFEAENAMQIALSHISETPRPPTELNPEIPPDVERELLKALEKEPGSRHETAGEFIKALKRGYGDLLPSPRQIAPELAQSHTPVMETPVNFEQIVKEQRKGTVVEAPQPESAVDTTEGDKTPRMAPPKLRRRSRKRYRIFLLVMIAVVFEMGVVLSQFGDEAGLTTPPTVIAELLAYFDDATATITPTPTLTPTNTPVVPTVFFSETMNVRSGPGLEFDPPIGSFRQGETTEILAVSLDEEWLKVRFEDGEDGVGWVFAPYVEIDGDLSKLPTDAGPATATPIATDTPRPTNTRAATDTPAPSRTPTPEPEATQPPASSTPKTEAPIATNTGAPPATRTAVPTNTPRPAATGAASLFMPGEGEPVTLFYNFATFALRNDSEDEQVLDVRDLMIMREDKTSPFSGDANNLLVVPPATCVVITSHNQPADAPEEWGCESIHNLIQIPMDAMFWRQTRNSEVFLVLVDEESLAECPAILRGGEDTCEFNWPLLDGE
jgi:serine/threonine protein kinase/uncharacterized protein YraI